MPLNIPMPELSGTSFLKGLSSGGNLFTQIMHPVLEREKQKQLEAHFQEKLKLEKAAAGRAAQAASDAHRKMDPMYEINQFKALQDFITGGGQIGNQTGGQVVPSAQQQQPTQEMGEGLGMFTPEGMNQAQQQPAQEPQSQPNLGGINLDALKQNPLLRGFFKHKFGYDPLAQAPQTPKEKNAAALELFNQKEDIKAKNKSGSGETLTAPIKTKYQNVIGGVSSARPILKKLIEETKKGNIPGQIFGAGFNRDAQATYKGEISTLLDGVRNAYTIPNTDSGTQKAEDKVLRKAGESDANYTKRLESILAQMESREKDARTKLKAGNITAQAENTVTLYKDGVPHDVPESVVQDAIDNWGYVRG